MMCLNNEISLGQGQINVISYSVILLQYKSGLKGNWQVMHSNVNTSKHFLHLSPTV